MEIRSNSMSTSTIYCIYDEKVDENIYETIKYKKKSLPTGYDEVFQTIPPIREILPSHCCMEDCISKSTDDDTSSKQHDNERRFGFWSMNYCWKCCSPLWAKLTILVTFIIVTIIAAYLYNIMTGQPDTTTNTHTTEYLNTGYGAITTSPLGPCKAKEYYLASWYNLPPIRPLYTCAKTELINVVTIEPLRMKGYICDNKKNCSKLITTYLNMVGTYSKFTFYLDNEGNVYGGRRWSCQFLSAEIWVAIMVDNFGPHSTASERERILVHLYNEIFTYANKCNYFDGDVEVRYVNGTYI